MALLSSTDQDKLREAFAELKHPVKILFFSQTLGCETCPQTRQIIDELPPLSDKITVDEVNLVLDPEKAKRYGVARAPALALLHGGNGTDAEAAGSFNDSRIRFMGTPAGYEFMSLINAVLLVGGRASSLTEGNRKKIAAIDKPLTVQVFTTPT
jgi:alkyl hydroperoxide reductase subunit AhpF